MTRPLRDHGKEKEPKLSIVEEPTALAVTVMSVVPSVMTV